MLWSLECILLGGVKVLFIVTAPWRGLVGITGAIFCWSLEAYPFRRSTAILNIHSNCIILTSLV